MDNKEIRKVIIVGGGAAGWLSAGLLAKKFSKFSEPVEIQLIEAEDVPVIGVGEGTFPTMLHTLQYMG